MSIERTIVSAMKQASRSREQEMRRMQKAQERANKENYLQSRIAEAERKTQQLLTSYEKYNNIVRRAVQSGQSFSFESAKKKFVPQAFSYSIAPPTKRTITMQDNIPAESWMEKIFPSKKAKRINFEQEAIRQQTEADEEYTAATVTYNERKSIAEEKWTVQEKTRQVEINAFNAKTEQWETEYLAGEESAIQAYLDKIFFLHDYSEGAISKKTYSYNKKNRRLILEISLRNKESLFQYEGYKYVKQQDSIEPINMKVTPCNQRLKDLIINTAIGGLIVMFKNDIGKHFDDVVVNVNYDRICCASTLLSREQYLEFNFLNEDDFYTVVDLYSKIYKQLSTGVKPFDVLYAKLI